tara:strand:+ start:85 stop:207 length:123 start_codon:yes stop_codon:yes gene_type:complete
VNRPFKPKAGWANWHDLWACQKKTNTTRRLAKRLTGGALG